MDKSEIVNEWINIAEMDLASAKFLQNMQPAPIEIICYHCQQSAEKFLKSYLALKEHDIVKTHDLIVLNSACLKLDTEFELIQEECLRLTDYGVNIRYPYPMDLNETDAKLALNDSEKIKNFILTKINL
jgi:HEPN domain-containing protein